MRKLIVYGGLLSLVGCSFARGWTTQTGSLVVAFTDKLTGEPITNATVTVKTLRMLGPNAGVHESHYQRTSARTDTNGIANVEFQFLTSHFEWWVDTPSHYSGRFGFHDEFFDCQIQPSEYENMDTNTVDGLAKYNELLGLYQDGKYLEFSNKFASKRVEFSNKNKYRRVSFYPRRNARPMYMYVADDINVMLPTNTLTIVTNGIEITQYPVVEFDLRKGACLPPYGGMDDDEVGEVADMRIARYKQIVNGVTHYFGTLDFPSGGGAYKRQKTGDASFPTAYEVETNSVFCSTVTYSYHVTSNDVIDVENLLSTNEYMVLRTRIALDADGAITNCCYSKIVGEMWVGDALFFHSSVFNPQPNDPNLEADLKQNLAGSRGESRWP